MNIAIYLYDNAEVLDFAGPFEVFATAKRLAPSSGFNVFLIAEKAGTVQARGGFAVSPHYAIHQHPPIDLLLVAGGVHSAELHKPVVIDWVSRTAQQAGLVASVCTGAFILAEAGLLDGLEVTTHWEDIPELQSAYPALRVVQGKRWVDQGKWVTSGGISAGIDMSLHLVERLAGRELAEKTARQMEFEWRESV